MSDTVSLLYRLVQAVSLGQMV